jgi:enhanced entry protein EnhC
MKSILPWFCLVAVANYGVVFANEGLDAYREGNYVDAAKLLNGNTNDPVVNYYLGRMRLYGYGQLKSNIIAMRNLTQAAEKGVLPAIHIMARYALFEDNNQEQALNWFKKAANMNDTDAQMYCAAAYLFGLGTRQNSDLAKRYYIAAARSGNSIAQYTLAASFLETHQSANKKLGLIWLNKSLEQNNPEAQIIMSGLYMKGNAVERNLEKAKELAKAALAQGYVPAMYQMGVIAQNENNLSLAKDWYTKAADAHFDSAEIALAQLYFLEKTPFYDPHAGFLWMLKSAQNGNIDAQLALAALYKKGQGTEVDEHLAKEWQQKALDSKNRSAQANIKAANWLSNGKALNLSETIYQRQGINAWHNTSGLKENNYNQPPQMELVTREALYKPKFILANPSVIEINEYYDALVATQPAISYVTLIFPEYSLQNKVDGQSEAKQKEIFKQLENQAILGDSTAQFDIAQMYQRGIGINQNIQEAIKYYQLASTQQDLRAEYNLGILYLGGQGITPDYKLGIDYLKDAAFKGNVYAQYVLAHIYEYGYRDNAGTIVIQPDHDFAIAMYNLASVNNYGLAQYRLAEILVREKPQDLSTTAKAQRNALIKGLYQGAVLDGIAQAELPLAFYDAMETDKNKQDKAFGMAKKAAEAGNIDAALLLGLMYDRGVGVAVSHEKAIENYQRAESNPIGAFILGTYLSEGDGVDQDLEKGQSYLQQAADAGFSYANLNLAILKQQKGEAFLPDLDKALALGNSAAGLLLADYYFNATNEPEHIKQAQGIYQKFAEKGDKEAQLKLAYALEHGLGVTQDFNNAQMWYTLAAEQGQPLAQYLLAHLYQLGWLGSQPDYAEAKKWYAAASKKYAPAAVALGFIYDTVDDSYQQARQNYQLAADQASAIGAFDLGLIYEKGKGQPVDYIKATERYLQAANQGHRQAMVQLAGLYFSGATGTRDEQQSLHWYKKAADLGDRDALYQLGLLSETGVATKLDYQDAIHYYQEAADKGNAKAKLALARMYQYGLGVPKDIDQATKFYRELSLLDNAYAQYQLAMFQYNNESTDHLAREGMQLLQQAAINGSGQARKMLQLINAKSKDQVSFIEPVSIASSAFAGQPADLMYLHALSAWSRGDESSYKNILRRILSQYPDYTPAKRAYEQLSQQKALLLTKALGES